MTRFAESIAGDLGVQIDSAGGLEVSLANPRGDAVTSVAIPAGIAEGVAASAVTAWSDYSEYGTPADPASAARVGGPAGYAFLGGKQRSTSDATAGLTLMGDRLYNPARGLFTSLDPEPGGNENAYNYPSDPINAYDLDGHREDPYAGGGGGGGGRWVPGRSIYEPIPSRSGPRQPSWSTSRSRYWKNEAKKPGALKRWGKKNLDRMKQGKAPIRFDEGTGRNESMELSHEPVPKRHGGKRVVPRLPSEHAARDSHRRLKGKKVSETYKPGRGGRGGGRTPTWEI